VTYNGRVYTSEANLMIFKEGESGTNGTDMVCRIVPVESVNTIEYPMVTSVDNSKSLYYNYKVELYKNGTKEDLGEDAVTWSLWVHEGGNPIP
jgi:hypothetical protein